MQQQSLQFHCCYISDHFLILLFSLKCSSHIQAWRLVFWSENMSEQEIFISTKGESGNCCKIFFEENVQVFACCQSNIYPDTWISNELDACKRKQPIEIRLRWARIRLVAAWRAPLSNSQDRQNMHRQNSVYSMQSWFNYSPSQINYVQC
jgi:hypothetical protein